MTADHPITSELLLELKKRAAEANSLYDLARRAYKQQQRRKARAERQKEEA